MLSEGGDDGSARHNGRNEMDLPLCGPTAMSHNEFQSSEPIEPQEASPMKHEMHVKNVPGRKTDKADARW